MLTFETGRDGTLSVLRMAPRLQEDNSFSKVTPIQIDLCFHLCCPRIITAQALVMEVSQYNMKNKSPSNSQLSYKLKTVELYKYEAVNACDSSCFVSEGLGVGGK